MEYLEKAKWPSGDVTAHEYKILDEALRALEQNKNVEIVSSELYDENNKLIATYKKGEGVKMVEEVKQIEVSRETFNFIMSSEKHYYRMFADWSPFGNSPLDKAMSELNRVYCDLHVSDIFDMLTKGEAKLVPDRKQYRVILKGLHRFEGVQTYSEYVYLKSDGTLAKTKSFDYITVMSEESMKKLPKWAQELAKEVK